MAEGSGEHPVVVQKWEESEQGWGTRPDGFSLHLSTGGLRKFVKRYWDSMPDKAPSEYSRPSGTPYEATVDEDVALQILASEEEGIRIHSNDYPGDGGPDGWRNSR